jgi:hypothetical protein
MLQQQLGDLMYRIDAAISAGLSEYECYGREWS